MAALGQSIGGMFSDEIVKGPYISVDITSEQFEIAYTLTISSSKNVVGYSQFRKLS